jgi:hypothetical protein
MMINPTAGTQCITVIEEDHVYKTNESCGGHSGYRNYGRASRGMFQQRSKCFRC